MLKKTVVIVTEDDLKEALTKHFVDFFVASPTHLADLIRNGKTSELPNLATATPAQLAQMCRDNRVSNMIAHQHHVDVVLLRSGDSLEVLFENKTENSTPLPPLPPLPNASPVTGFHG